MWGSKNASGFPYFWGQREMGGDMTNRGPGLGATEDRFTVKLLTRSAQRDLPQQVSGGWTRQILESVGQNIRAFEQQPGLPTLRLRSTGPRCVWGAGWRWVSRARGTESHSLSHEENEILNSSPSSGFHVGTCTSGLPLGGLWNQPFWDTNLHLCSSPV